jgi:hypothetical protein
MNHADRASILMGISPKKMPPSIRYSMPFSEKPWMARKLVTITISETVMMLTSGFTLDGTKGSTNIPDKKIITNAFKNRPIDSFPSNAIIL